VKVWKVILATIVIFATGVVTGALLSKSNTPAPAPLPQQQPRPAAAPVPSWIVQERFLQLMKRELTLTPEQVSKLESVFADSRERMQILMDLINPELQAEKREVADRIRAELTPEQRTRFEQLIKRQHKPDGTDRRRGERRSTNTTSAAK
jgi:Spy/CpxP family protein refolding chaperone